MTSSVQAPLSLDVALQQAVTHHQAGRLAEAEELYRAILQAKSDQPDANHNLGVLARQVGQPAAGLPYLKMALEIIPDHLQYLLSYAEALLATGFAKEALNILQSAMQRGLDTSATQALRQKAEDAVRDGPAPDGSAGVSQAECNHLAALFNTGRFAELENRTRELVERYPDSGVAWKALGLAFLGQGKPALPALQKAAELLPDDAEAHNNLGTVLKDLGKLDEAVACHRRALEIRPDYAEAHSDLGIALKDLGQLDEAVASYRRALAIKPDFAEARSNLAGALRDRGQLDDAVASYLMALEIRPDYAEAHYNLGNALNDLGRPDEAGASYRRALEIKPDYAEAQVALVMLTLLILPNTIAESVAVPGEFDRALKGLADWMKSPGVAASSVHKSVCAQLPFYLAYRDGNHVERLSCYGDLVAENAGHSLSIAQDSPRKKLRLAVVSQHFHRHSVWRIITRGLLMNLDRQKFELVLYYTDTGQRSDEETAVARSLADVWRDVRTVGGVGCVGGWKDAMVADHPDIILYPELGMDHIAYQLATCRLASIQAAGWGHPMTSGLPTIDLFFSGEMLEPPEADTHYRERLVRLPGTGCCTEPLVVIPEELDELKAELALRPGPRFVIAQAPFKFDPADDELYARIADSVGESTFILLRHAKFPWATDRVFARLGQTFRERGLVPEQHLMLIPWLSGEQFYSLLELCDVYLDCPSFSGYTTAWQAVHCGLPVVTLEGKFMRQRLAAGLLRKIGITETTETIATSAGDYVTIATRLAEESRDPERYRTRRNAIRSAASNADADVSVVRAFEKALMEAVAEKQSPLSEKMTPG